MILKSKICGVSDTKTLKYIVNHKSPSQFIGFIVNYPKSKRYVDIKKLIELTEIDKKNSLYYYQKFHKFKYTTCIQLKCLCF